MQARFAQLCAAAGLVDALSQAGTKSTTEVADSPTEVLFVLEGAAFVTNVDGSAIRCLAGDTVVLPEGWSGRWDVIESLKAVRTSVHQS